jgi:hypothetical protein
MLERVASRYDLQIEQVNILDDPALLDAYGAKIPVIDIEGSSLGKLEAPIDEGQLRFHLELAHRSMHPYTQPAARSVLPAPAAPAREPLVDRVVGGIGRHWLRWVSIGLAIFVGLPWLAPVFAALGWWNLADPIYTAYAVT